MNLSHSTTPQSQKSTSKSGSGPKGDYRTYAADAFSLQHCFTCPLHDCVGTDSPRCPIFQARVGRGPIRPIRSVRREVAA